MNSGDLRHQITLQSKTETSDGMGGITETWADQLTTWAQIDPPKSREFFGNGQMQTEIVTRIRIRYRPNISHEWRVKFGTRYFEITSIVNPDECNQELIIMGREDFSAK
jgi:SPP1 family predicted phage head-tail adaptor